MNAVTVSTFNAAPPETVEEAITQEHVAAAQNAWATGIVAIGKSESPMEAAENFIDEFYAYDMGVVLFKPTLAQEVEFRTTREQALSYFVTGKVSEDRGFALAPFVKVEFDNKETIINRGAALAMGHYYFTRTDGSITKANYSFGYIKAANSRLKINLHHSSLPYVG